MTTGAATAGRDQLAHDIEHWGHLLPSQGPMTTFVHHNTLHGLQHHPFARAVAEAEELLGGRAYEPVERYRSRYHAGRITADDLAAAFAAHTELGAPEVIGIVGGRTVTDAAIRTCHLLHGVVAVEPATLRYAAVEGGATKRFADHVGAEERGRLLSSAQQELAARLRRVGDGWTLADLAQALLDVDAPGAVRREIAALLAAGRAPAGTGPEGPEHGGGRSVTGLLDALGIPAARHHGYLEAVDVSCAGLAGAARDADATRRLWLAAERRVVRGLARRHFGVRGALDAIESHLTSDVERYALTSLWHACLTAFGLPDPFSPSQPVAAVEEDPDARAERLADRFKEIDRFGGPAIPLPRSVRVAVKAAADDELEQLRARASAEPANGASAAVREAACAAWFVLSELSADGLSRRGADALEALRALRPGSTRVAEVADAVGDRDPRRSLARHLRTVVAEELDAVGGRRTHAELVARLTGDDVVERVNRYLVRRCAAFLDLGQAAWRMPDRPAGFYEAWRRAASADRSMRLEGVKHWREAVGALPERAEDAVVATLSDLGVDEADWGAYVGRVLVGLPGWAGMMNWRGTNPGFPLQAAQPADLVQYLAVRLFVEAALVRGVSRRTWGVEPAALVGHLRERPAELWLRRELRGGRLPGFLAAPARPLAGEGGRDEAWSALADKAWLWASEGSGAPAAFVAHDHAWRLFRLAQLEGWSPAEVRAVPANLRDRLLAVLDSFPEADHRAIWLSAYERHYRQQILGALAANRGRGRWRTRDRRPKAQIVLCIDEREESLHRAIDEMHPEYETFGAGGFFGVAMDYSALDDHDVTPLCPAGVIPANRVLEVARHGAEATLRRRESLRRWQDIFHNSYWEAKRNAVSAFFVTQLFGLVHVVPLFGRVLAPRAYASLTGALQQGLVPTPPTELTLDAGGRVDAGKPVGFTLTEQADKVEAQLRNIGMTYNFARLVVFCGHGSVSVNNPHESAHDCGACGGKHGGPNGRAFAALANRAAVRAELAGRGIVIPDDTHFVGAIHNTASDLVTCFDTDAIPETHQAEWHAVRADLDEARARSARERCRRFASAPSDPTPATGLRHVEARSRDLSQVRPEWGHCTNAFAVVGRRCLTQGAFFDRRGFVISYDPTQDPTGAILERILVAIGPVGAGINLEYYFSSVDNRYYGCDTKVPHNVSGLLGVMEGAASDLRTGLPKQMIEIHEPMRLLLIVESTLEILGGIYGRQAGIAELLDNAWVQLVAMDPTDGRFNLFVPGQGFVAWEEQVPDLPVVETSLDYYRGRTDFLPPALIEPRGRE